MTEAQTVVAGPLLNSYAHGYLGLPPIDVLVAGAHGRDGWGLIVARTGHETAFAKDFDEAKQMIDEWVP